MCFFRKHNLPKLLILLEDLGDHWDLSIDTSFLDCQVQLLCRVDKNLQDTELQKVLSSLTRI